MSSINPTVSLAEATRLRISPASRAGTNPAEIAASSSAQKSRTTGADAVEISPFARALSTLRGLPETRGDLVSRVRDELKAGTYDADGKLDASAQSIADEILAEIKAGL